MDAKALEKAGARGRYWPDKEAQKRVRHAFSQSPSRLYVEQRLVPPDSKPNDLSVSPVVNTEAFHRAFDSMPVRKRVRESLYVQAGRLLRATSGTMNEHLIAVDARTGELVADNLSRVAGQERTSFDFEEHLAVAARKDGVVLLHNHPNGVEPGYSDMRTAAGELVVGSAVVGHDGSVWWMAIDDPEVAGMLARAYDDFKLDFDKPRAKIKAAESVRRINDGHHLFDYRRLR